MKNTTMNITSLWIMKIISFFREVKRNLFCFSIVFQGSQNIISQNATWACEYICDFEYNWYPFDIQHCFIKKLIIDDRLSIRADDINYIGGFNLGRYFLTSFSYCETVDNGLLVQFSFSRPMVGSFTTIFLPTGMLLLIR